MGKCIANESAECHEQHRAIEKDDCTFDSYVQHKTDVHGEKPHNHDREGKFNNNHICGEMSR